MARNRLELGEYVIANDRGNSRVFNRRGAVGQIIRIDATHRGVSENNMYTVGYRTGSVTYAEDQLRRATADERIQDMAILPGKTPSQLMEDMVARHRAIQDPLQNQIMYDPPMRLMPTAWADQGPRAAALAPVLTSPKKKSPPRSQMPKHLKGLKAGDFVKITETDDEDEFRVGDVVRVVRIDHSDNTVRCYSDRDDDEHWVDMAYVKLAAPSSKIDFDSVILDDAKKQKIIATMQQVDNYELIFSEWGFDEVLEKGRAISMLFHGLPGTGKTLMAQAIADRQGKKLKIVGSAEIESSEPGQAERNIKAFFENTKDDTVLLFDECDSLVYSREHVGSILAAQVNQLLSSLETFEGIVIFTTNRLGVLDEAFNRRLSLKVEFAMPNLEERMKIWQRMFPKKAPVADDIDWERLAEVELSGGYIKNVVLRAARVAAAQDKKNKDKKITMQHLVEALSDEIESVIEFEEARKHNHTPRMMGGGMTKGISR